MRVLGAMAVLACVGARAIGQDAVAGTGSAAEHPVLVELFTSEGCSSCPPADAMLARINGKRTPAGTLIVTLSEHVTYWNHDGWADRFSSQTYTDRQASYQERFHLAESYTPQAVVNGGAQVVGSDGAKLVSAIDGLKSDAVTVHVASAKVEGKKVEVTYQVDGLAKKGAVIYVAMTDDTASTEVKAGENKGRTMTHVSVVRSLDWVTTLKDGEVHTAKVNLPDGAGGHHVVVVAQESGVGKVLGVGSLAL